MQEHTPATSPGASPASGDPARQALRNFLPEFYAAVGEFEDLKVMPGLSPEAVTALETKLDFSFSQGLRELLTHCAAISMAGLSVKAAEFGPIVMPGSDALIIGEFYLHNPGDRLLMLPDDPSVYYLEQRNGAITKMADDIAGFFNRTLLKYLYSG
ncbi:SMI1/KNR4 family protein [Desulfovibrio sp. SGI.169]|uniref:SMI1/KNR4 family protein n=1 Tax=Desulfovibrio sp. SGI.169 TaxID=3420561 RepID=UPI003D034084